MKILCKISTRTSQHSQGLSANGQQLHPIPRCFPGGRSVQYHAHMHADCHAYTLCEQATHEPILSRSRRMSTYPLQYIYKKSFQLRRVRRNSGDARQGHAYVSFDSKHAFSASIDRLAMALLSQKGGYRRLNGLAGGLVTCNYSL